jgi:DNA repair exonuclease SbcCD nuclease subunit
MPLADRATKTVRLIHASDMHLGARDSGVPGKLYPAEENALKALVELSIRTGARLIIIAGDFFDHNRVDGPLVESTVRELSRIPGDVVILPGNHDCLVADSVYRRECFLKLNHNVRIFSHPEGERFSYPELDLAVWGKPIVSYVDDIRPLADLPPRGKERWQIAVAHGLYVGDTTDVIHSLQISQREVIQSGYDYVALGHRGVCVCVCDEPVKAYYSSSRAVVMVDCLEEGGIRAQPSPLDSDA